MAIKKILLKTSVAAFVLCFNISAFAAGYDVVKEPYIDMIDGTVQIVLEDNTTYDRSCYFLPTPFYKGFSVVHNNVISTIGETSKYFGKTSYVVDSYGNKVDVGTYDCFGVYPFDFDENASDYLEGYNTPALNPMEGVDSSGHIIVCKDGKGGLIDTQGNIIIPCEYDNLLYSGLYDDGQATDAQPYSGKYFMPYYYPYFYYEYAHDYYNGLAVVAADDNYENTKVGIVDTNDNIIVPFIYDMITPCYDGTCWVMLDGKWGIINVDNSLVSVKINGNNVEFDQIPLIINGRTLAPLRAIFEALDATVDWDDATKTVTSTKGNTVISMTIGNNEMSKNGEAIALDVAPQIVGGRTLVPVRAIAESFNCDVSWDAETKTVTIKN